jgi:hypothetical protein
MSVAQDSCARTETEHVIETAKTNRKDQQDASVAFIGISLLETAVDRIGANDRVVVRIDPPPPTRSVQRASRHVLSRPELRDQNS